MTLPQPASDGRPQGSMIASYDDFVAMETPLRLSCRRTWCRQVPWRASAPRTKPRREGGSCQGNSGVGGAHVVCLLVKTKIGMIYRSLAAMITTQQKALITWLQVLYILRTLARDPQKPGAGNTSTCGPCRRQILGAGGSSRGSALRCAASWAPGRQTFGAGPMPAWELGTSTQLPRSMPCRDSSGLAWPGTELYHELQSCTKGRGGRI